MLNLKTAAILSIAGLLSASIPMTGAGAATFTIYNTGVDNAGAPLANFATDGHYTLITSPNFPAGPVAPTFVVQDNTFPIPPWVADSSTSKWIAADGANSANGPVGNYDYRTTFNLTGFNASTANINGLWSADNTGLDILINGVSTGNTVSSFDHYSSFAINSGFVNGLNTIDFLVNNAGGPEGLRVEGISGTANLSAVPEPSQTAALVLGVAFLAALALRKRGVRAA